MTAKSGISSMSKVSKPVSRAASLLAEGDMNAWLIELKKESESDGTVQKFMSDIVLQRNKKWKKRIKEEEGFFKKEKAEEIDMRTNLIKWRAHFEKQRLNNELNKLHVYDPSMAKRDLTQNLQALSDHKALLGTEGGIEALQDSLVLRPHQMAMRSRSEIALLA